MIATKYLQFRKDLQNGMTISEGLTKYKITLGEAFNALQYYNKPKISPTRTNEYNIRQNLQGHYFIIKWIHGKQTNFGTYTTVEDAVKIRDWFMENGWDKENIDKACTECGVTRRTIKNRRTIR